MGDAAAREISRRISASDWGCAQSSDRSFSPPYVWIHAVSVGEVLAISGLVEDLRRGLPQFRLVISTTTDAGQKLARTRFGEENVFYFPLDFAFAVRPYLLALRPRLIILAETEFWPNFLRLGPPERIPGGRRERPISDRSCPGYRRFRPGPSRNLAQH